MLLRKRDREIVSFASAIGTPQATIGRLIGISEPRFGSIIATNSILAWRAPILASGVIFTG